MTGRHLAALALCLASLACGADDSGTGTGTGTGTATGTATGTGSGSGTGTGTGSASTGAADFAKFCAACHGAKAAGASAPAINGASDVAGWTDAQFLTAVRTAKDDQGQTLRGMPTFSASQLTDAQVAAIFAHLKTL
jgi:mono/diheme cytochrome c family protein